MTFAPGKRNSILRGRMKTQTNTTENAAPVRKCARKQLQKTHSHAYVKPGCVNEFCFYRKSLEFKFLFKMFESTGTN